MKKIVYVTKWVLTRGIIKAMGEPEIFVDNETDYLRVDLPYKWHISSPMKLGRDVFYTAEEAEKYATDTFCHHAKKLELAAREANERAVDVMRGRLLTYDARVAEDSVVKFTALKAFARKAKVA